MIKCYLDKVPSCQNKEEAASVDVLGAAASPGSSSQSHLALRGSTFLYLDAAV